MKKKISNQNYITSIPQQPAIQMAKKQDLKTTNIKNTNGILTMVIHMTEINIA